MSSLLSSSRLLGLVRAIRDFLARAEISVDDVVAALGVLRSVVFGDLVCSWRPAPDASRLGDIVQLAEPCKQEREENVLFKPDVFGVTSSFLLYKVAPEWLSCFTHDEKALLFDAFFLAGRPSEVLMALVPAVSAGHPPEQELDDPQATFVCSQAERLLVKCFVEAPGVRKIAEEFGGMAQPLLSHITQVAQLVASIPDRVTPKAPTSLLSPSFFISVVSQLLCAAKDQRDPSIDILANGKFIFIGEVFSKLSRRGHAAIIALELVPVLSRFVQSEKSANHNEQSQQLTCWQALLLSMKDFHAIERMSEATLQALDVSSLSDQEAYSTLYALFGDPCIQTNARNLFTNRFLLWKTFSLRILKWILDFSVLCQSNHHTEKKKIQTDVVRSLAETWAEKNYIQSATMDHQKYVTAALGICIRAMTKDEISGTDGLLKLTLEGVSRRLDSPLLQVRRMAKQIALAYSIVINPKNPLLLDDDDTVDELSTWDVVEESKQNHFFKSKKDDAEVRSVKAKVDDPDAVVDLTNPSEIENLDTDDDSESDASLKPYNMSDDESDLDKAKFPSQLSSCAASLRKSDDPDAVERGLDVCEKFVRLMPDELENSAADLTHALVHVRCSAVDDRVESKRYNALVALLVCAPLTSAAVLTKELYSVHVDVSQRLMILDVLSDAAQELASGTVSSKVTGPGPWKEVSHPFSRESMLSWGPSYERELPLKPGQPEVGKSRRWGNRSLELRLEKLKTGGESFTSRKNGFAPVASAFMLPVMRDYDKKRSGLDIMGTDFIVLARMIITLGICMQCLSCQPNAPVLAAAVIDLLRSRSIFKHPEPYVRRAVLFAASRVLTALHPSQVASLDTSLTEGLEWIREWSFDVSSNDPDPECAKMAVACLHIHSEVAFQTSRLLEASRQAYKPSLISLV